MNALLIHNDNLPTVLIQQFETSSKFDIGQSKILEFGFSFDREAHEQLSKILKGKKFNVIFLPYTLSNQNYLELSGLRLALHIRLTKEFNHTHIPIVFIGHESRDQISKLSDYGSLLFTTGIFNTDKFEFEFIKEQYNWILEEWKPTEDNAVLNKLEYSKFLQKINIDPPANYDSHHSIGNELSLLRWSEYIGCDAEIPEVKKNVESNLFFKLIKERTPQKPLSKSTPFIILGKSNILLIDDESEKGWKKFYQCLFKNSQIKLKSLTIPFNDISQSDLIKNTLEILQGDFNPDVILLDLRLLDSDFNENNHPEDLTGYKILKSIKNYNRGIQTIITTASTKVWNYEVAKKIGADGYIVKRFDSLIELDFKNVRSVLNEGVKRSHYLKAPFEYLKILQEKLRAALNHKTIDKKFGNEFLRHLEMALHMFYLSENKDDFAFAYLALFKCLELINDHFLYNSGKQWEMVGQIKLNQYKWDETLREYRIVSPQNFRNESPSAFEKIAGLSFQLWNFNQKEIRDVYYSIKRRNEFIHPSENGSTGMLKKENTLIFEPEGFLKLFNQIKSFSNKFL